MAAAERRSLTRARRGPTDSRTRRQSGAASAWHRRGRRDRQLSKQKRQRARAARQGPGLTRSGRRRVRGTLNLFQVRVGAVHKNYRRGRSAAEHVPALPGPTHVLAAEAACAAARLTPGESGLGPSGPSGAHQQRGGGQGGGYLTLLLAARAPAFGRWLQHGGMDALFRLLDRDESSEIEFAVMCVGGVAAVAGGMGGGRGC